MLILLLLILWEDDFFHPSFLTLTLHIHHHMILLFQLMDPSEEKSLDLTKEAFIFLILEWLMVHPLQDHEALIP